MGNPYVMLFEGRSGSTYLTSMLEQHPRVGADYEPLALWRKRVKEGRWDPSGQADFVREKLAAQGWDGAIGFKTKLRDIIDRRAVATVLRELGTRVVLLRRRNRVKVVVSSFRAAKLAERTGDWNVYDPAQAVEPFAIPSDDLLAALERREAELAELEEYAMGLRLPTLAIFYEDLLADPRGTLRTVLALLDVEDTDVAGLTEKHTSDDLRDSVTNFDELRATLARTRYEAMLLEGTST